MFTVKNDRYVLADMRTWDYHLRMALVGKRTDPNTVRMCSVCGARPKQWCVAEDGFPREELHTERATMTPEFRRRMGEKAELDRRLRKRRANA